MVMSTRILLVGIFLFTMGLLVTRSVSYAVANEDAVAAITKIENDTVKADIASDRPFFEKLLADDWTFGDSNGSWVTKAELLQGLSDPANYITKTEEISDLKVRIYSNTAIATYSDTFEDIVNGAHSSGRVISTDTFVKIGGEWKEVASHSCPAK
jgi:hypothetical protein